ncbi:hypothetical protein HYALB_00007343 [Hymenoscyphus albidus]|uniref:Uncharacterized protein n=1 Tax=Hymenoscyphus albidus TaxID=595503 RepID=A0A9N9LIK2_9HELO|nr:hypothetical protein HYALB_00007343 [Hymenoscyphus albidus]
MIFSSLLPSYYDEDLDDLKACRLACKRWTEIGFRGLFGSTFVFRRDRMDTERFLYFTTYPRIFSKIDRVIFDYGWNGIANVVSNYASIYASFWNSATNLKGVLRDRRTAQLESQKESHVRNYASQRIAEFGFLLLGLAHLYRYTLDSNIKLKHLSHDMLPTTFFGRPISELKTLVEPLRCLQTLHLTFDATEPPTVQFWKGLGFFLASAPQLRNLRYGFDRILYISEEGIWCIRETGPGNLVFNEDNAPEKWYAPLWKVLGDYTWAHLEHLRLDGMVLCERGIFSLLCRHSNTLRTLELHQIGLWLGSFENLLLKIRNKLSLTGFGISGHCEGLHSTNESRDFPRIYDPYREIWSPAFSFWVEQCESHTSGRKFDNGNPVDYSLGAKLKNFIFGDSWPIMGHHTRKRCTDFPECVLHTEKCIKSCWRDTKRMIDQIWDKDFFIDPGMETPPFSEGTEAGQNFTSYYNDDGFDEEECDIHGYNEEGEHYLDDIVTDEEYLQGMTTSTRMRRELEASIVHRIPRFWGGQKGEHGEETMTVQENSEAVTVKRKILTQMRSRIVRDHMTEETTVQDEEDSP